MATRSRRTQRFNFRATSSQARLIERAADEARSNVSAFVLESACMRAEETLASKQHFEISRAQWEKFMAALDRDPQQKPGLRKLMTEKSVLER